MSHFKCISLSISLLVLSSSAYATDHTYRIKVNVDSAALNEAGLVPNLDDASTIANDGDLSLYIVDESNTSDEILGKPYKTKKIGILKSEGAAPVFSFEKVYNTNTDFLNIGIYLVDKDYVWLAPWTWGQTSDDVMSLVSLSLAPGQLSAVSSFSYSKQESIRIVTNSNNKFTFDRIATNGIVIESKTLTSINEYETTLRSIRLNGYSIEITKLK